MSIDDLKKASVFGSWDTFHERIGALLDSMGGTLVCHTCGKVIPMSNGAEYLRDGWPRCCKKIMEWTTRREIKAGGHRPYSHAPRPKKKHR